MDFLKKLFKNKVNVIVGIVIFVIILICIFFFVFSNDKEEKFKLNKIYDVYPEDVRELYSNMVEVSCKGDLYFDTNSTYGEVLLDKIGKESLLDYLFSYMDKNLILQDEMELNVIKDNINKLFAEELDLINYVDDYSYGGYVYNVDGKKVIRSEKECTSKIQYVSQLFGYYNDDYVLHLDVNIGYLDNGILYDLEDNKLGEYDGEDVQLLSELFQSSPYYRINYVLHDDGFKLNSVEFNIKY